jgi:hypothetical protein
MKNIKIHSLGLLLALALFAGASRVAAQVTAFTYQGQLNSGANPATGLYDFEFSLYTNAAGTGTQIGSTLTDLAVGVTNGLFTTSLNFGAVFGGNATWLAISVRSNGVGSYAALTPLQPLTAVPYAVFSDAAGNLSGTLPASQLSGTVANSQLANNGITVNAGTGLSGGGGVALGGSTTLNNAGVLSVAGNGDITAAAAGGAVTLGSTATSADTAGAIVKRDASGNFSAGTITLGGTLRMANSGDNTGVGAGTLANNTSGFDNTATGMDALNNNTTGFYNTATGMEALNYNTTGFYNTANGAYALLYNTNGYYNTANGVYALAYNTNGYFNTANGALALYLNNGSDNTANGAVALIDNTTGNYNTASGAYALYENTNGNQNTASGAYALEVNRSGNNNTANGYLALQLLGDNGAGGSNNIALGYLAGSAYMGNESSNIDIGNIGIAGESYTMRLGTPGVISNTFIAGAIIGNGIGLSNLNGSQVTGGTIPLAQLPGVVALLSEPGTENFFAGQYAGNSGLSGGGNTGVGYGALYDNTSGFGNTAQGFDALGFNTAGNNNAGFGVNALFYNSTGSNNAAFGAYALDYNTTGNYNTGTGAYALSAYSVPGDLTAGGNTADGAYALFSDETGYNDTAAGYRALYSDTTGFDNVAIGVDALPLDVGGFQNTAVGTYSLQVMTAGNGNIAIGCGAGNSLVAGTNNIFIGNGGSSSDNEVIRIGGGQTATYISGVIALDGSDTNYGLEYLPSGLIGVPAGAGPFLYGWNGGALGSGGPTSVSLSWDWTGSVWVSNNLSTATLTIRGGSDLAEPFKLSSGNENVLQGSVMVIDGENAGQLKVSTEAYDTRVAGVISGANGIHPGIQMQQQGLLEGGKNVALTGRVYVLADAGNGAIQPGDLLTTSDTPGHAMKVSDHAKAQGAILGKAMSGLKEGRGMVLVLVTLQ